MDLPLNHECETVPKLPNLQPLTESSTRTQYAVRWGNGNCTAKILIGSVRPSLRQLNGDGPVNRNSQLEITI